MSDPIVTTSAPILHKKAKAVPDALFGTAELKDMIHRMSESLRETEHGVAIAAVQIDIPYRIFVVRGFVMEHNDRDTENVDLEPDVAFINPKIIKRSRKRELLDEACLSVPGYAGRIKRSLQTAIRACDTEGICFERGASGLLAQVFQHECDHLEGILYIDKAEEVFEIRKEEKDEKNPKNIQ